MELLKYCREKLKGKNPKVFVLLLLAITGSLISFISPIIYGDFIDRIFDDNFNKVILAFSLLILGLTVFNILVTVAKKLLHIHIVAKLSYEMNVETIRHLQHTDYMLNNKNNSAYLTQRISGDINSIISFVLDSLIGLVNSLISFVLIAIIFNTIDSILIVFMVVISIVYLIANILYKKPMIERNLELKERQSIFFNELNFELNNSKFIRSHSLYDFFFDKLKINFKWYYGSMKRSNNLGMQLSAIESIGSILVQIGVIIVGAFSVHDGSISIGDFTIMISLSPKILGTISYLYNFTHTYRTTKVSFDRLMEIEEFKEEPVGEIVLHDIEKIELNNLSFGYNEFLFENLNHNFEKGKIYVLKGVNGSGKSTLIDLIIGINQEKMTGEILYNGINLKDIELNHLRYNHIEVLEQLPVIFPSSLKENIVLDKDIENRVIEKKMGLFNFNEDFINRMDMDISESGFSGGEKQKIAILRSLIGKKSVLIYDEPTSSFDIDSKKVFISLIKEMKKDKIIIISTHDKEIIEIADDILELDT